MARKRKIDNRRMMENAVEVMRKSIEEGRHDGKKSPAVGAVIILPDGRVEKAYRGELRDGDHAEFTLLERKLASKKLDGSVLFSTLEPCMTRNPPKIGCARRIVLARIQEVYVGIGDPDPTVDGKGMKYLEEHGVTVQMFDRDLQEEIEAVNAEFIEQAVNRKAAAENKMESGRLSSMEKSMPSYELRDYSRKALEEFRIMAKISEAIASEDFNRRLLHMGLLQETDDRLAPTGFGAILFGRHPREIIREAGLLGTIHYADGSEETAEFDGPQALAPEQGLQWLRDKLPNTIDRKEAQRKRVNDAFYELVREGVINALVHRDYTITGTKCHLIATPEAIIIKSPGRPVKPITIEQMQAFNAPMRSRNPSLHYVFARMRLAEERGLGLKSMKMKASDAGLPLPKFSWEDPYIVLTLYQSVVSAARMMAPDVFEELSASERKGWEWLSLRENTTTTEYAAAMRIPGRTALNHLKRFVDLGLLRRVGAGRASRYEVVRP